LTQLRYRLAFDNGPRYGVFVEASSAMSSTHSRRQQGQQLVKSSATTLLKVVKFRQKSTQIKSKWRSGVFKKNSTAVNMTESRDW